MDNINTTTQNKSSSFYGNSDIFANYTPIPHNKDYKGPDDQGHVDAEVN